MPHRTFKISSSPISSGYMSVGEDDLATSRGFVVKVSDGKHYGEYSFNQITEADIDRICERSSRSFFRDRKSFVYF